MASTRRETTKPGPLCSVHQPRPVRSAGSRKRRSVVTNDTISAATTTGLVDAMEYVATSSLHTDVGLTEATLESTRQGPQDRLSRSTQAPKPWVTHHGISRRMMSLNPVEGDPVRQLEHMDRFWSGLRAKSPNSASKEPTVVRVSDDRIPIDGPGEAPSTSRTHDCDGENFSFRLLPFSPLFAPPTSLLPYRNCPGRHTLFIAAPRASLACSGRLRWDLGYRGGAVPPASWTPRLCGRAQPSAGENARVEHVP